LDQSFHAIVKKLRAGSASLGDLYPMWIALGTWLPVNIAKNPGMLLDSARVDPSVLGLPEVRPHVIFFIDQVGATAQTELLDLLHDNVVSERERYGLDAETTIQTPSHEQELSELLTAAKQVAGIHAMLERIGETMPDVRKLLRMSIRRIQAYFPLLEAVETMFLVDHLPPLSQAWLAFAQGNQPPRAVLTRAASFAQKAVTATEWLLGSGQVHPMDLPAAVEMALLPLYCAPAFENAIYCAAATALGVPQRAQSVIMNSEEVEPWLRPLVAGNLLRPREPVSAETLDNYLEAIVTVDEVISGLEQMRDSEQDGALGLPPPPSPPPGADGQGVEAITDEHHRWVVDTYSQRGEIRDAVQELFSRLSDGDERRRIALTLVEPCLSALQRATSAVYHPDDAVDTERLILEAIVAYEKLVDEVPAVAAVSTRPR
jgi:hypothetical protein